MPTEATTNALASSKPATSWATYAQARRRLTSLHAFAALSFAISLAFSSVAGAQTAPAAALTGTGYETAVYANTVSAPYAAATDLSGNIYYSDFVTNTVYRESAGPSGFTQIAVASFGKDSLRRLQWISLTMSLLLF